MRRASGGGAHSKPGRARGAGAGRGSTAMPSSRASVRSSAASSDGSVALAFHQGAAQGVELPDRAPRRRIERHVERHRERRPLGQRAGGVVQQQLFGGRMAAHGSSFSNASRRRPRARRMRDFTVPSGSFSSSAMTVWVLSSKKAFWMTTS